jgi:hypothetical protein
MKTIRAFSVLILFLVLVSGTLIAQIQITSGPAVTPEEMVENIVGSGIINFDNVTFSGANASRGIFSNGQTTNLGLDIGVFLTSGAGYIIPGPNNSSSTGVSNGMPGDATLNTLTTSTTYDAAVLEFDFIPKGDTLKIRYVFGSEEYSEDVGSNYNDVFGLFVTGPNPAGGQYSNKNIALVPGTTNTAVKVNSINNGYAPPGIPPSEPGTNSEYYADNTGGMTLQYDGFTIVLTAWLPVVFSEQYHIKIAIADCGDGIYDSGIFLEENSFISCGREIPVYTLLDPPGLSESMVEGHVQADLVFKLPPYWAPWTIYYIIGGNAINGEDYETINDHLFFEYGVDSAILHITPIQDNLIEGDETIVLTVINNLWGMTSYEIHEFTIRDYVELYTTISPNTTICSGDSVELCVNMTHGLQPYTIEWQPGSFTNDTIMVNPDETTIYTATYHDALFIGGSLSTIVTVLPDNLNDIYSYSFELENNPGFLGDVVGVITGDTVFVGMPEGTAIDNLVANFIISNCAGIYINGTEQLSGVTANDFINPVIYQVSAQNGDIKEWTVVVKIETGLTEEMADGLILFPNPSEGKFYFETAYAAGEPIELQVMDLTGRVVYQTVTSNLDKAEIDLSDHPKGMYFIRIKSGEMVVNRKVIIQ